MQSVSSSCDYKHHLWRKIRFAKEPDNPALIDHYLDIDTCRLKSFQAQKDHYECQFRLLLETVADELVPAYWRCCCLDHINKPLLKLNRLSKDARHQNYLCKLKYELNMTCHYVLQGLAH